MPRPWKAFFFAKLIGGNKKDFEGELIIKGKTNPVKEKGTITVKGNIVEVQSKFNIALIDYDISFVKGKPSTNVAKVLEVTVHTVYVGE